jgi:catechol 2,3-dioxygenase-like lactoylglutathione lyase family enzyme
MIPLQDIRYVRLGTANLEHAVEFAQKILGLQLSARERNRAYLRSDDASTRCAMSRATLGCTLRALS